VSISVENVRNKETETPFEGDRRYMSEKKKITFWTHESWGSEM
jgi:hypothetical protein